MGLLQKLKEHFKQHSQDNEKNDNDNDKLPKSNTHIVLSGDTLWMLSSKYNVPYEELLKANPQITNPNLIYVGQTINVPTLNNFHGNTINASSKVLQETQYATCTYTVLSGDTLWMLSSKYNVPYEELLKVNPQITNPNLIYVGQTINVPTGKACL